MMRRSIFLLLLAGVVLLGVAGCSMFGGGDGGDKVSADGACDVCAKGKAGDDVYCDKCDAGYVSGEKVTKCKGCHEVKTGKADNCEACAKK